MDLEYNSFQISIIDQSFVNVSYFVQQLGGPYCHDLIMLTHNLVVTGAQGMLVVWDARLPDPVRRVRLGCSDKTHSIRMMQHLGDTIACNYGNQLRLVRFPMLFDKID